MRGRVKYVPANVIDRLLKIKKSHGDCKDSEAWGKMASYVDIGLNVDDFYSSFFGDKRRKK